MFKRIAHVVTSDHKIYSHSTVTIKKGTKTSYQFYLITNRQQRCKRIQLHGKSSCISNDISINITYSLRDLQNNDKTVSPLFYECTKTQTIWPYLTEFLPTKNTTVEITRLEALFCISIGSHCCIKSALII